MTIPRRFWPGALLLVVAGPAAAQNDQSIPSFGNFSLPSSRPTPLPTAVPTAVPTSALPALVTSPDPRSSPTPRATPTPKPSPTRAAREPTAAASPTPTPNPTPDATQTPSPPPVLTQAPAAVATTSVATAAAPPAVVSSSSPPGGGWPWWGTLAIGLAGAAVVAAVALRRRSRENLAEPLHDEPGVSAVPPDPPGPPSSSNRLALSLRPLRAGLNLLSATVEAELTVTNAGGGPAADIRIAASLLSASRTQDADLAAAFAQPVIRPATPPFALASGESRTIRIVAALARNAIEPLTAAGRPMMVPIVALNCRYRIDDTDAQTTQAFAVGVERVDSAKLAPFWLDGQPRMHDQVAARVQGTGQTG